MNPTEIYDKPGKSAMGMDLVPVYEDEMSGQEAVKVDPVIQQNMGIRLRKVKKGPLIHSVHTYGHITPDETLTAQVNLKTSGWIEKLFVDFTGKYVKKGEPLFEIYSPDLVAAQEEYLVAHRALKRMPGGTGKGLIVSSRRRLQYFDVPESEIEAIEESGKVKKTLMIRSPLSGFVIERKAEKGAYIKAGTKVFRIADLSRVWVDAHIYEYELSWIAKGQRVEMTLPYLPGMVFFGLGGLCVSVPAAQDKGPDHPSRICESEDGAETGDVCGHPDQDGIERGGIDGSIRGGHPNGAAKRGVRQHGPGKIRAEGRDPRPFP